MKEQPMILAVDDDAATLSLVKDLLSADGYLVDTAVNGRKALSRLEAHPYDLVLTDMLMPEMGGMELVQYLRLNHPDTLIIVFTGFANYQDAVSAVKLGAFDYLTKPLQPEILRHAVKRALEHQRLSRSHRDLELVFKGAEAMGWQALELVLTTPEAQVLKVLREKLEQQKDLKKVGHLILAAARDLVQATRSSIFLFDASKGQFSGLAALGSGAKARAGAVKSAGEGLMGYVATHRRPLLVADLSKESRFPLLGVRSAYDTQGLMIIPMMGYKFWGLINLTDRQDKQSFGPRDLFLGWLLGRLLVEILESREPPAEFVPQPLEGPWVFEEVPLGLALLDQDLKVVQSNPALERLSGLKGRELVGQEIFPRLGLSPQDQEKLERAFRQVLSNQELKEFSSLKTDYQGKPRRFLGVKMVPWPSDRQARRGLLLVEDVSELERLKQRLNLYEHLAIMGKLALCVAHELNNPLDGIRRYLSLALMKKEDHQEVERYLTEAQKGLQKMSLSIKSLLFSANPFKAPPRVTDNLHSLLQDAIRIMMFQASDQRVQVAFHPAPEFQNMVMEADLYYVFINVIKNALEAMPQGGQLTVNGTLHKDRVEIAFEDTGPGLSPQEVDQIFQPFYSTKKGAQGLGLGLGLSICQKILNRYGGRLVVASQPGEGSKVSVILPQAGPGGQGGQ
ncbi:MAG: response regulator [Desulfobaccales bacterium]|nr:response regulator [Desulfobaccales bacterium]